MPTVERRVDIAASPQTVWGILSDPSLITKLVPDILTNEVNPPGMATLGQKAHAVGKIAGRKVEFFTEVTEVQPTKKIVFSNRPGGLFKSFQSATTLEPSKKGTRATTVNTFEASLGYLGKVLTILVVNRSVKKNSDAYLSNLKEIAELKEMPKQAAS